MQHYRILPALWTAAALALGAAAAMAPGPTAAMDASYTEVQRGRYLFQAGDCAACHVPRGGDRVTGGRAIPTPFGTIYSTNITPDPETGIGRWSEEDFYRAMHEGRRPDGTYLYPAFPYRWYSKLTREDVNALKAYLDTLAPVRQENRPPDLPWPLSWRATLYGWRLLFFEGGTFTPDPEKSDEWNRGAYLVEAAGHCSACHSPKNLLGAVDDDEAWEGGYGEGWFSPKLTGDPRGGLGTWSVDDIVEYLRTGSNRKSAASGPMAEVIEYSTQHLSDSDLRAMAVYLKDLPGKDQSETASEKQEEASEAFTRGEQLYVDNCSGCHLSEGQGQAHGIPPLSNNAIVQSRNPDTLLHTILDGGHVAKTQERPTALAMPPFGWKLDDGDAADLATYLRNAWGNQASTIDKDDAAEVRQKMHEHR